MTKPVLDHLHGDIVCQQERGTAVPQIMEPDFPKPVFFENNLKMIADILRGNQPAQRVYAYC
jgi:hypothetical protein